MDEAKIILFLKQRVKVTDEEALQFASFFREKNAS